MPPDKELRLRHGQPATFEPVPTPGQIRAAVMRAHGRNVTDTAIPSAREIRRWVHDQSSRDPGGLRLGFRRAARTAEKQANH